MKLCILIELNKIRVQYDIHFKNRFYLHCKKLNLAAFNLKKYMEYLQLFIFIILNDNEICSSEIKLL